MGMAEAAQPATKSGRYRAHQRCHGKCSFCIQRIKEAHNRAKNEGRKILDGEIQPACLQTCPTGVFTFGNLMDEQSKVRKMAADQRAYQVMGYLNTKPAVIYLKKVMQEI